MKNEITLIKASAGSGKTFDLMKRLSSSIKEGVDPEKLLATTFTVKAAAELQSRIRQQLIIDGKPELANRVFDGLIGTVDGICGGLLCEYAIEAGLSPALDVISEDDSASIFASSLSAITSSDGKRLQEVDSAARRIESPPIKINPYKKNNDWKFDVQSVTEIARSNKLAKEDLKKCSDISIETIKKIFSGTLDYSLKDIVDSLSPLKDFKSDIGTTKNLVNEINEFIDSPTWGRAAKLGNSAAAKGDVAFDNTILSNIGDKVLDSKQLLQDISTVIEGVFEFAGLALDSFAEYKAKMGLVDFVDQECRVLNMFETNKKFCSLMKERVSKVMVDEFQDTSPIQLALFLKLNEFSKNGSVWVGDPKQAIYGFRGTDSELMEAVSSTIPKRNISSLEYSWRSKEKLVDLSNEIFRKAFKNIPEEEVVLKVPEDRSEKAKGGDIEAWHLSGTSEDTYIKSLASGIKMIIETNEVKPEDICVLMRANSSCEKLAKQLSSMGIPSSASGGNLLDTTECRLVMAAFRYCINQNDTAALAVLCAYYGERNDVLNTLLKEKENKFETLRKMSFWEGLLKPKDATPIEILDYVITTLKLDKKISNMRYSTKRIQNIEKLKTSCIEYMKRAQIRKTSATAAGFVDYIQSNECKESEGFGPGTVNVLTYHSAKGLEWPIVILCSLDNDTKGDAFGCHVIPANVFDAGNPLKGRTISYWPYPFGAFTAPEKLFERIANEKLQKDMIEKELKESRRLMYVGVTRAKNKIIFAIKEKAPTKTELKKYPNASPKLLLTWLDNLSDEPFIKFPQGEGEGVMKVGNKEFKIETRCFSAEDEDKTPEVLSIFTEKPISDLSTHYPANIAPSSVVENDGKAKLLADFNCVMNVGDSDNGEDLIGNAIHNYIAVNPADNKLEVASRLLKNWRVDSVVSAKEVIATTDKLYEWINKSFQKAEIRCEVPMLYTDEHGTVYQGYIDMLIETNDGYIIVDHKTHNDVSDAESYAASCVGQLRLYKKAIEKAMKKSVRQMIINMPAIGRIYEVF